MNIKTIQTITTPSTEMWGDSMKNLVKIFVPIVVTLMTVYSLGVDIYRKPSLLTDWLFQNHTTSEPDPTPSWEYALAVETPTPPKADLKVVTPTTTPQPEPTEPVRRRATRKRGLSEIRSLTA